MDCALIFIGGKINTAVAQKQRLFQLCEQQHAPGRSIERGGKQSVITARVGSRNRAAGKAAQAVCLQPFAAERGLKIAADSLVKADHCSYCAFDACKLAGLLLAVNSAIIRATSAVHPV